MGIELQTGEYEDWMKEQVIDMICEQYGYDKTLYTKQFTNFYEPAYQNDAVKVILLDDKKVTGFMGFFCWPYTFKGKTYRVFQAGNVIVDPTYRGQRIFHRMVEYMGENYLEKGVDMLVGFPVPIAFNTYIRNGWKNIFDLNWWVKINNPLSPIFPLNISKIEKLFPEEKRSHLNGVDDFVIMADDERFNEWRSGYYKSKKYYYTYEDDQIDIQFGVKLNKRKKVINEMIIGEVLASNYDPTNLKRALKYLLTKIKQIHGITIVSFAANPDDPIFSNLLNELNFRKIEKKIFFVAKNFSSDPDLMNSEKWSIFRGDLDTW